MIDHQDLDLPLSIRDEAFCQILRLMCGLLREPVLTRAAESLGITHQRHHDDLPARASGSEMTSSFILRAVWFRRAE